MKATYRRAIAPGLILLGALSVAPGCESLNLRRQCQNGDCQAARASSTAPSTVSAGEAESSKVLDVQSEPSKPQPFFKSSRLSGGLSNEAREIERHVGVQ